MIVAECTDTHEDPRPDWLPRKQAYIDALAHKPQSLLLVSLADMIHNASSIVDDER